MNAWGSSSAVRDGSVSLAELGAARQEEGNVGAEVGGELVEAASATGRPSASFASRARRRRPSCRHRGRRQPGSACRAARQHGSTPASPRDQLERAADQRVVLEPLDDETGRALEPDPVGEVDPLKTVVTSCFPSGRRRADDQCEVDLRVGEPFAHASSRSSSTNSGGARASARVEGERPSRVRASTARGRSATPASSSELGNVLRRCAKAASTTRFTDRKRSGSSRRRKATSAESTFGCGLNTVRATGWKPVRSAASCTRPTRRRRPSSPGTRRSGQRPRAGPSRTSSRPTAGRRGSRRRSASRCCTEGSRRACPAADRGSRGRA